MNYRGNNGGGRTNYQGYGNRENTGYKNEPVKQIEAMPVPTNYVDAAESVIVSIGTPHRKQKGKLIFQVTTTKLRNIFSMVSDIYNVENRRTAETISDDSSAKLQMLRIRVLYEAGRDPSVQNFIRASHMLEYIKGIGTNKEAMIRFAHYMEALVAYHRYYGGREN